MYLKSLFTRGYVLFFGLFFFISCANIVAPTGGVKDTKAPALVQSYPLLNQTNFNEKKIVLVFDENLQPVDLSNQIIFYPPLKEKPLAHISGKKVIVKWKEDLKDSTTYIIDFKRLIKDYTEANVLSNFKFAFSTGSYIDSLHISGKIYDIETQKNQKDVWVGLYRLENKEYSVLENPDFITQTDEKGRFYFSNLPAYTSFYVAAYLNKNIDKKYNEGIDKIAFMNAPINLKEKSISLNNMYLYTEKVKPKILDYNLKNNLWLTLVFNTKVFSVNVLEKNRSIVRFADFAENNVVKIWLKEPIDAQWISIVADKQIVDSLFILSTSSQEASKMRHINTSLQKKDTLFMDLDKPIDRIMEPWVYIIDTGKTNNVDTIKTSFAYFPDRARTLSVALPSEVENKNSYIIYIPKRSIRMLDGTFNETLVDTFTVVSTDFFGDIKLNVSSNRNIDYPLILKLKHRTLDESIEKYVYANQDVFLKGLKKGTYDIWVYVDKNRNKKWDPGSFALKKQPEPIFYYEKKCVVNPVFELDLKLSID